MSLRTAQGVPSEPAAAAEVAGLERAVGLLQWPGGERHGAQDTG